MPAISDAELKRRLEAHNYPVPPITESTKRILLKKLNQLDKQAAIETNASSKLLDYSSAEEDSQTPKLRQRRNFASSTPNASNGNGQSNGRSRKTVLTKAKVQVEDCSKLVNISDEDDDLDDEEESESSEDENGVDMAVQTSLNSELNSPALSSGTASPVSTNNGRRSQRFLDASPISPPVRSTASYMNGHNGSSKSRPRLTSTPTTALSANSPLRKAVGKNRDAFGSLGKF